MTIEDESFAETFPELYTHLRGWFETPKTTVLARYGNNRTRRCEWLSIVKRFVLILGYML